MIGQTAPVSIPKRPSATAPKAETVLATDQLVKIYGGRAVVDGVNLHVRASEIVGLLGPNGAGKDYQLLHDRRLGPTKQRSRDFS